MPRPIVEATLLHAWLAWDPCDCLAVVRTAGAGSGAAACPACAGTGERPREWGTLRLALPVGDSDRCVLDDAVD